MLRLICRVWQIKLSTFLACKPSYHHLFYINVRDVGSLYGCAKKKRKKREVYMNVQSTRLHNHINFLSSRNQIRDYYIRFCFNLVVIVVGLGNNRVRKEKYSFIEKKENRVYQKRDKEGRK